MRRTAAWGASPQEAAQPGPAGGGASPQTQASVTQLLCHMRDCNRSLFLAWYGLSNRGPVDMLSREFLLRGRPGHCKRFRSIPSLYPLDTVAPTLPRGGTTKIVSERCQMSPGRRNRSESRATGSETLLALE